MNRIGKLLRVLLALFVLMAFALDAVAQTTQTYPQKNIRIVVPLAPGGSADIFSRIIGARLTEAWGQPVVVDNKPGGGGNIGSDFVAKSTPDGYTLLMGYIGPNAVNPSLFKQMPYDAARDFAPILLVAEAEGLLVVNPSVAVTTVPQLIALARANPGKLAYASGGIGTAGHLSGELFKSMAQVDMIHVPYKGNVPAITDLIGGQIELSFATMPTVIPHVRAGKLRGVAVIGATRAAAMPGLPTVAETLPGFAVNNWIGLFAPAGTPPEIVNKLNAEVMRIMQTPEAQKRMTNEGARFTKNTPEEFAQFVRDEAAKWARVLSEAGIKPE